jgi:hypothetical protein
MRLQQGTQIGTFMKAGMKLLIGALAASLTSCCTPTSVRVSQLEARIRALENNQNLALARIKVLIRAAELSPRSAELQADGTLQTLELLAKVLEQPPQQYGPTTRCTE